eukprot:CAMPEP_0180771716 /NCGR_PEP_ID=MMETSP1038_2-20121128/42318_1 /TAXON_ID=632150 /ORGANISM="Azadinium spinosum, Strain 3D9" /LENGTH=102 /DNA_ID=CAMNT_0022806595 /DNA_START=145 /DNA_END=451 /DNA_ORIENTATION=+
MGRLQRPLGRCPRRSPVGARRAVAQGGVDVVIVPCVVRHHRAHLRMQCILSNTRLQRGCGEEAATKRARRSGGAAMVSRAIWAQRADRSPATSFQLEPMRLS